MTKSTRVLDDLFARSSFGAPENAIGFVLWRVLHRYVREVDAVLAPLDLTHLQFTTLAMTAWLGRSGKPVTQSELAKSANIHPMQVSLMLKALESKGMVTRAVDSTDVRAKRIETTAAGVRALRRALPAVIEVQGRLFGQEGKVGGGLLTSLLRFDVDGRKTAKPSG